MPEFQRERCILLAVAADKISGELPQFFLRMNAKVCRRLLQRHFALNFLEHVEAQRVERVAVTVLVD